ncbi:MAG: tail fiber protein [Candidatus Thiodiazotropha sp. (ex Epidulcina cf. delphinae)]|nr:tail fiber protein [Candidatus Thiodiazotropha sp. (ex Epidulcina cf. delphinae)]
MSEPFIAEIRMFGCGYAPRYWADCTGTLISIGEHTSLYSIIGTVYGGDGRTTMGLPNLAGRAPMHAGHGPGLSFQQLGMMWGFDTVPLTLDQLPAHNHDINVNTESASTDLGEGKILAKGDKGSGLPRKRYLEEYNDYDAPQSVTMASAMLSPSGGSSGHANLQPYLTVRFCMALEGIYPSRS